MKTSVWGMTAAILLAGCASVGQKVDQSAVTQIKKGKSTKQEVRRLIGDPNQVTVDSEGTEIWTYTYAHAQMKGATFIPVVGAFAGGMRVQNQVTTVKFSNGVVKEYSTSYGGTEVTQGLASGTRPKIDGAEGDRSNRTSPADETGTKADGTKDAPAGEPAAPAGDGGQKARVRF